MELLVYGRYIFDRVLQFSYLFFLMVQAFCSYCFTLWEILNFVFIIVSLNLFLLRSFQFQRILLIVLVLLLFSGGSISFYLLGVTSNRFPHLPRESLLPPFSSFWLLAFSCPPSVESGLTLESWRSLAGCSFVSLGKKRGDWELDAGSRGAMDSNIAFWPLVIFPREASFQLPAWGIKAWLPAFWEWIVGVGWCLGICFILIFSMVPMLSTTPGACCSPEIFLRENELPDQCSVSYWAVTRMQDVRKGFGIRNQLVFISIHSSCHFQRCLVPLEDSAMQTGSIWPASQIY